MNMKPDISQFAYFYFGLNNNKLFEKLSSTNPC